MGYLLHPEEEPLVATLEHQLEHPLGRLLDLLQFGLFREDDEIRVLHRKEKSDPYRKLVCKLWHFSKPVKAFDR